jgi:hypothetical protein
VSDHAKTSDTKSYRIPANSGWATAWQKFVGMAVVGLIIAGVGLVQEPERFPFSWLYACIVTMTVALGTMFFVLYQHLARAGWSVTVRRTAEFYASGLFLIPILVLPAFFVGGAKLYPWWGADNAHAQEAPAGDHADHAAPAHEHAHGEAAHGDAAGHDAPAAAHGEHAAAAEGHGHHSPEHMLHASILAKKHAYLNQTFFGIRWLIYLGIFWLLGSTLLGRSVAQDASGDLKITAGLQRFATWGTLLFGFSLTFAGFDWVMSMEPNWYSTMFGVRVFASSVVVGHAVLIYTTLKMKKSGLIGEEINKEHYHDLGKLQFGFLVFWAYISFSEFFLIWYAAIPEETIYYHHRWDAESWRNISIAIVVLKFILPFYVIMSRNVKRNFQMDPKRPLLPTLGLGVIWLMLMQFVEIYYWIMPNFESDHIAASGMWVEVGCLMFTLGVYLAWVFKKMTQHALIPIKDPRLNRALGHSN